MKQSDKDGERQMKVLGITGGVGSGKSEVLLFLEKEYDAYICQLDEVAKKLQKKGSRCFERIVEVFGEDILRVDGELDRAKLAERVFTDAGLLKILNEIVHPEVKKWVVQDISEKKENGVSLYIIEAALLPGAGYEEICDEMWYIYTEENVRRKRLKSSRGYSDEKITDMIGSQPTEEQFRQSCTKVINNSGTFQKTKEQIGELLL